MTSDNSLYAMLQNLKAYQKRPVGGCLCGDSKPGWDGRITGILYGGK